MNGIVFWTLTGFWLFVICGFAISWREMAQARDRHMKRAEMVGERLRQAERYEADAKAAWAEVNNWAEAQRRDRDR
jgi:F0F1-type ATP synthase membrane subunit b/b'